MPNYCNYEIQIKGSKEAIQRVIACLEADYDYNIGKPEHKHFFRVFSVYYEENEMEQLDDNTYILFAYGDCAWSVHSCMCSGEHTYYNDCKNDFGENFMGTTLQEQSQDCEIEVFSEEEGMEFSEHYYFKNGECLIDDCVETQQAGYTKSGKISTKINWDKYDGEIICLNPNREGVDECYRWTI